MSGDLIERLRALDNGTVSERPWLAVELADEAADALEAKDAEIAELKETVADRDEMIRQMDWAEKEAAKQYEAEIARLSALVEEAGKDRGFLVRFDQIWTQGGGWITRMNDLADDIADHLRAARSLSQKLKEKP